MTTGRAAKADAFAASIAEAAKRRHVERIETRTEALPEELAEAVAALTSQMLTMQQDLADLKRALGEFYIRTERKVG